jgi:hypothetical protein
LPASMVVKNTVEDEKRLPLMFVVAPATADRTEARS